MAAPTPSEASSALEHVPTYTLYKSLGDINPRGTVGTGPFGSILQPHSCANVPNTAAGPCLNYAEIKCSGCHLVQYCSKDCQIHDWNRHWLVCCRTRIFQQEVCPFIEKSTYGWTSPLTEVKEHGESRSHVHEETVDIFDIELPNGPHPPESYEGTDCKKFLWGNTPPLDILNLAANEGLDYHKDLRLSFRGADDIRHVMKTILSLPEHHTGHVYSHIYEKDFDLQIRNILILMLALYYPDGEAAELITHLWYSASIPCKMYILVDKILRCLEEILELTKESSSSHATVKVILGSSSITMNLSKHEFEELYARLNIKGFEPLRKAEEKRRYYERSVNPFLKRKIEKHLNALPPKYRAAEESYRSTGILSPFNASVHPLRTPNPTFYDRAKSCLLHPVASPLDNHDLLELRKTCIRLGLPTNDLHGAVFFQTRELVTAFCSRLAKVNGEFFMTTCDIRSVTEDLEDQSIDETGLETASEATTVTAEDMPVSSLAAQNFPFDRILTNRGEYLHDVAPFLKPHHQNPHATILELLPQVTEVAHKESFSTATLFSRALSRLLPHKWHVYTGKAHAKALEDGFSSVHEMRKYELAKMEIQDRELFEKYISNSKIHAVLQKIGLKIMDEDEMRVAPAWPYRLEMSGTEKMQEEQFELRFSLATKGCERLVECKAISDGAKDTPDRTDVSTPQDGSDVGTPQEETDESTSQDGTGGSTSRRVHDGRARVG